MKKLLLISLSICFIVSCNKEKKEDTEPSPLGEVETCKEVLRIDSLGTYGDYFIVFNDETGIVVTNRNFSDAYKQYEENNTVCATYNDFWAWDGPYQDRIND